MNTFTRPASLIHEMAFPVNSCTRPKIVLIFIPVVSSFLSHKAQAINVVIEGTSTFVCPNKSVTYSARTFEETFGIEIFSCSLHWEVFKGSELVGQGYGVNFTYTFGELFVEYDFNDNRALERLDGQPQHQVNKPRALVFKVDVFDRTEKLVRTGESKENKVFVDTRGLQTDTYFLHIYAGDQVVRKQIIVEN